MRTRPWTMLLMMLAGWLNRHHQDVIEYLKEENKILREKIGKKRIILNDNQRMRLGHGASISVAGTFGMLSGMDGAGVSITFIDFHFPWRNLLSRIMHITMANVVVNIHST